MKIYTVNYIPSFKAYSFVISQQTVTIRAFQTEPLGQGRWATDRELAKALREHGTPFDRKPLDQALRYPGSAFMGQHDKAGAFMMVDEVCWKLDPALLGAAACSDRAAWMFMDSNAGRFTAPFNRTLAYLPARANKDIVYADRQQNAALTICQPFADSPLEDCTLFVKYNEAAGYFHEFLGTIPRVQGTPSPQDVWPRIRLIGPTEISADGYATVHVEVLHPERDEIDARCNSTLYLEDVDGYCPNLRAKVTEGRASFRVGALGLEPGEKVRIKVGWRNWPGEADYIANVT